MFYTIVCFNATVKRGEPGLCRETALYKLTIIIIIIIIIKTKKDNLLWYTVCFIRNENRFMDHISTVTVLIILKFTME